MPNGDKEPDLPELFPSGKPEPDVSSHSGGETVETKVVTVSYEAPLPPPQHLQFYETIEPGFAGRIMSMAEKAQRHQHVYSTVVALLAFTVCISVLGVAAFLIYRGHALWGMVALLAELALLVISLKSRS